ncbi:hypothetical protein JM93_01266 [Roseibium hamelinense]|uniref:Uncharacterized protein n=1 Tax=Roseibium hamelinense TaxID=150831 RepID=A0A562TBE3_9HYPH|nr:hypothetical protein [Roseibium hamelinense]MTI45347.1 hypothetical protein [Roseibium hamelinense]TWI90286.1 hypothetical protein JM93_01266 [Roseibium hamelinense]
MVGRTRAAGRGPGQNNEPSAGTDLLKKIISGYLDAAKTQEDYQSLYRSLPSVIGIAGEIAKRQEETDKAMTEALSTVENILKNASAKAAALQESMSEQHALLERAANDKSLLADLLKSAKDGMAGAGLNLGPGPGGAAMPAGGGKTADPKLAYQMNQMMGNVQTMVAREVERQIAALRAQAEKIANNQTSE